MAGGRILFCPQSTEIDSRPRCLPSSKTKGQFVGVQMRKKIGAMTGCTQFYKGIHATFHRADFFQVPRQACVAGARLNRARVIQTGARERSQSREEKVERALSLVRVFSLSCVSSLSRARLTRVLAERLLRRLAPVGRLTAPGSPRMTACCYIPNTQVGSGYEITRGLPPSVRAGKKKGLIAG